MTEAVLQDALGHLFYFFLVLGHLLVARKHRAGFLLRVVGGLSWAVLGAWMGYTSIILWSLAFAVVDFTGWHHWRASEEKG